MWEALSDSCWRFDQRDQFCSVTRFLTPKKNQNTPPADTFVNLWRLLTNFKGLIRLKKELMCVYKPNSNNLKIWKCPYLKKDFQSNFFAKTKKFAKPFSPVHMASKSNLLSKNDRKSRDTVPLNLQKWRRSLVNIWFYCITDVVIVNL